jgi:hypothetical protein
MIVASMALADRVYDTHSRRLRWVLLLGAALLMSSACLVARLDPGAQPERGWLHPLCPLGQASTPGEPG